MTFYTWRSHLCHDLNAYEHHDTLELARESAESRARALGSRYTSVMVGRLVADRIPMIDPLYRYRTFALRGREELEVHDEQCVCGQLLHQHGPGEKCLFDASRFKAKNRFPMPVR